MEYAVSIPDNLTMAEILATIQQLPSGYRLVFNLFAIEGYSHKEIANRLNISESTSKTQYLKARRKLQQQLAGRYYAPGSEARKENNTRISLIKPLLKFDGK